ncbi:Kinesin-like protein KIF21B [Nymphon striatum]|nr:Kinesin-like protein KIF21B [Nymphon striatum]
MGTSHSLISNEKEMGVIPRAIQDLFKGIREREDKYAFIIKASFLEIYKELHDLLLRSTVERNKDAVAIRKNYNGNLNITGFIEEVVSSPDDVLAILCKGSSARIVQIKSALFLLLFVVYTHFNDVCRSNPYVACVPHTIGSWQTDASCGDNFSLLFAAPLIHTDVLFPSMESLDIQFNSCAALVGTPWWVRTLRAETNKIKLMAGKFPHPLKRTRSQSDIEFSNDKQKKINKNDISFNNSNVKNTNANATATPWPRFLVIKAITEEKYSPLLKLSPFAIFKTIISIAGDEPKSVKRLISGDILVETNTEIQTGRLIKAKEFFNMPVAVSPHGSLNYSKGVIRSRELKDCSESELLTELSSQGVTTVKKILITRNGQKITTGTIILTFNIPEPPKSIKAAYLNVSVDKYIPNPLRCFKCQKFGHHQTSCKHEAVCGRCGVANHTDDGCEKTPCCVNCKGKHPSYSRECPNFTLEKKIVTHKYNYNTTFPEARRMVLSLHSPTSYAKVAANNIKKDASTQTHNVGTQTDHVWPITQTSCSASQTVSCEVFPTETKPNNKKKKNDAKITPTVTKPKNKTETQKESAIPLPNKNTNVKTKIKTYERVIKPLTPTQLKTSTESIDFPPMDVIRSAAESQETTSDNGMEVVIPENSPKCKKRGKPPKLPILPPS